MSMNLMQPQWSGISRYSDPQPTLALVFDPLIGISGVYRPLKPGDFRAATGSSIQITAAGTTGTFQCNNFVATRAIFINQNVAQYRVYKNNETGNDYLRFVTCNSGGWAGRVEIEGIANLNELAIQVGSTSISNGVSGVCIAYF